MLRAEESLILRCPGGASKDEAGALTVDGCKEQGWSVSFEAPVCTENRFPKQFRSQRYRFKLPNIPRTSARPTWVATVRATLFIAASTTVSRW